MRSKNFKVPTSSVVFSIHCYFNSIKDALQNQNLLSLKNCEFLGEQPSGFWNCDRIGRFRIQKILAAQPGLGTKPRYEAPGDL